ncbi:MAG: glycosyltransferase family 4 protein [Leptolyngbyaceae cyanobacterium SL_7_1]|nr:glycosyltransferase family 4 protein [Leptolyngbyaceae cyanobacterium SL_7_1]
MHLVVLENQPSSQRGGQEISLFDVCGELAKRGHRITLLYLQPGNLLESYQQFCDRTIPINHYRINSKNPISSLLSFYQDMQKVNVQSDSLVYGNQYHDSFFGYLLARSHGVSYVSHLRLPPPPSLGWQWSLGIKGARRLIAVSHHTKQDWVAVGCRDRSIDVVHNGVDLEVFKPAGERSQLCSQWQLPPNSFIISYIGRLDKVKGLETLISAFSLLLKEKPALRLFIAGNPLLQKQAYRTELEALARTLAIESQVTFLGHVADPIALYQLSDLTVLPSTWAEPLGRTLLESMACGTPVVASRTGGIPEVLTGEFAQALFQPGEVADLAAKLRQFLAWRTAEPELGDRCRQHIAKNFSIQKTVDQIESSLLSTLN